MYMRKPLVRPAALLRRRRSRCDQRPPAAPHGAGGDFARYAAAEFTDVVFTSRPVQRQHQQPSSSQSVLTSSASLAAIAGTAVPSGWRLPAHLHADSTVPALPPTHAVLNHLNSALWLQVLPRLHERGLLSSRDRAGAIRYLAAFTYRPLLPWLWSPTDAMEADTTALSEGGAELDALAELAGSATVTNCDQGADVAAEVYGNLALVVLEQSRRRSSISRAHSAPPSPAMTYTAADISTAAPAQWVAIATSVVAAAVAQAPPAALKELLRVWHDVLFAVRAHADWVGTPEQLQGSAHPQLLCLFRRFYADVRRFTASASASTLNTSNLSGTGSLGASRRGTSDAPRAAEVRSLTPPILLRKFRGLYQPHRNSAMHFAELYALCVEEEETYVHACAEASSSGAAAAPLTTALLMDLDLAVYYATLPGRRHSGLEGPDAQWAATLQHLRFLLPRIHRLQRCSQLLSEPTTGSAAWQPWRRVAAAVMNVCVWVSNDNSEATRCTDALRCVVDALCALSAEAGTAALADVTSQEVAGFVRLLVEAGRESMGAKAAQLVYGPTEGLFGVHLLCVAVSAVLPSTPAALAAGSAGTDALRGEDDVTELLHRLHVFTYASKRSPADVWAALHRTPDVGTAARHGLVTAGYRLFTDCIVPLAMHERSALTAQRLWTCLGAWATVVGRPLGLHGASVAALWGLRWRQERSSSGKGCISETEAQAVLDRVAARMGSCAATSASAAASAPATTWRCGCGFKNLCAGDAAVTAVSSVACASCVLRSLTPYAWECPVCHTEAASGVGVPYCLHCGAAHPLADRLGAVVQRQSGYDAVVAPAQVSTSCCACPAHAGTALLAMPSYGTRSSADVPVARFCWDCGDACGGTVSMQSEACAVQHGALDADVEAHWAAADAAVQPLVHVCATCHTVAAAAAALGGEQPPCASCGGGAEAGYVTAAFTWACGCGAASSALHAYCHACTRAASAPTVTCAHCTHVQEVAEETFSACARCHHPHPRLLAAVEQNRLVRCPACQGRVPATCAQCPHCSSTAVSVVAALLPTEADQPWLCHHCGALHDVRDASVGGRLKTPTHLSARASAASPQTSLPLRMADGDCGDEDCCRACHTRRLPAAHFERGRLWSCDDCGEPHNTNLACRRCAALAPGVVAGDVFAWRCAACHVVHPGWERRCSTAGCGVVRADEGIATTAGALACEQFCYTPWTCTECGGVTLSSHLPACTTCGAATPAEVLASACAVPDVCASTAPAAAPVVHRDEADGSADDEAAVREAPKPLSPSLSIARLAQVEAFLLRAAAQPPPPLLSEVFDLGLAHGGSATTTTALALSHRGEPSAARGVAPDGNAEAAAAAASALTATSGTLLTSPEPWEDAYTAAVISF